MEQPINILIVDDEPKNLTVLETVLEDPGFRLVRAGSAEQALLALVAEEFALLILDVRMPGMTGFELAQMIKERKKTSRVPIIFLTAYYNEDQHVLEGYGTGAVDYLHKPVNPAVLRSKVAVFAELHRKSREVGASNLALLAEVAERLRAEERLRELNESLERRVAERTRALAESEERLRAAVDEARAELVQSYERLRLSERMASLGTLSAGLGHDMGNLLVPIRIRLESLSEAVTGEQGREDLAAIRASAGYLQKLANGLRLLALDPSRSPVGETTNLGQWWAEAASVMSGVLPRNILLEADIPEDAPPAAISKAALTQVVFNLVQNAGDAMRAREPGTVRVQARGDGPCVRLTVSDDGPGMTPEVQVRCMEPFFTTKPRGISTGLGLTLVYGLMRDAGGSVEIRSELGKGTTFTLRAPVAQVVPDGADGGRAPGLAVLAVKDARIRSLLTGELRMFGFEVRGPGGHDESARLFVLDDAERLSGVPESTPVIFLGDSAPDRREGTRVLADRPRVSAIREALRALAGGGGLERGCGEGAPVA